MNFNTFEFLLIFLPVTLLIFYIVPARFRLVVLLAASLIFYGASGLIPLALLVIAIIWGFLSAAFIEGKKLFAVIAAAFPLLLLWAFKYMGFTLDLLSVPAADRSVFSLFLSVSVPAGISFYTFQIVAYSIDVYDRKIKTEKNPVQFAVFVCLFAQLIAGPILRYEQIKEQLTRMSRVKRLNPDLLTGIKYLTIGIVGKTFFSDILSHFHDRGIDNQFTNALDAVYSIFAYSFIVYYDFWSYSLMAIGLGKLFSLDLPKNFLEPYLATSPREFWRRWHVTLSFWIRDYVYLKLGGNKKYIRNIAIIFLVVGLWHGAGVNFVVWGAYHAVLVILYHLVRPAWDRMPRLIQIALTFVLVSAGWPLFYLDFGGYIQLFKILLGFDFTSPSIFGGFQWLYLFLVGIWTFAWREKYWLYNDRPLRFFENPATHGALFAGSLAFLSLRRTFIYFQF